MICLTFKLGKSDNNADLASRRSIGSFIGHLRDSPSRTNIVAISSFKSFPRFFNHGKITLKKRKGAGEHIYWLKKKIRIMFSLHKKLHT